METIKIEAPVTAHQALKAENDDDDNETEPEISSTLMATSGTRHRAQGRV